MGAKLTATRTATEMAEHLAAQHGPLAFFQSGGCCDGSSPICLEEGELPPSPNDLLLGRIAGAPFYVDCEQYARWGQPPLVIDVGSGPAEGFSLSAPDAHFVTRSPGAPGVVGALPNQVAAFTRTTGVHTETSLKP